MPAIKNFGYLWDLDRVFWGRPRMPGTLLGRNSRVSKPPLNRQGPQWKATRALQFEQENDDNLRLSDLPTIAEKQAELFDKIDDLSKRLGPSR